MLVPGRWGPGPQALGPGPWARGSGPEALGPGPARAQGPGPKARAPGHLRTATALEGRPSGDVRTPPGPGAHRGPNGGPRPGVASDSKAWWPGCPRAGGRVRRARGPGTQDRSPGRKALGPKPGAKPQGPRGPGDPRAPNFRMDGGKEFADRAGERPANPPARPGPWAATN